MRVHVIPTEGEGEPEEGRVKFIIIIVESKKFYFSLVSLNFNESTYRKT